MALNVNKHEFEDTAATDHAALGRAAAKEEEEEDEYECEDAAAAAHATLGRMPSCSSAR
jgi:hypothetical protein